MEFYMQGRNLDWNNPKGFQDVYESLERDQPCDVVMKLYEKIKGTKPTSGYENKCHLKSEIFRMEGNQAMKLQDFCQTLHLYNAAILCAPKSSFALKVAYSNRSALLFRLEEYKAALKDIDMCFELGCPDSLIEKLTTRKNNCLKLLWIDNMKEHVLETTVPSNLLQLNAKRNPQIPCASKAVEVNMDGPYPTVIAAEEIKPGTLVALETAFVTVSYDLMNSCYYCLKLSLNFIPCDNCCEALFCDQDCKERCLKEYHEIECGVVLDTVNAITCRLALKAVIKIKNECSSWCEFIQAFEDNCSTSNKNRNIEEIFNNANKFLFLHTMYNQPKNYGKIFMIARSGALLINNLANKSFFPINKKDRQLAMRATAGMFMHLAIYVPDTTLLQTSRNSIEKSLTMAHKQTGLFSFIGKLKHSCNPNLLVVPLKNRAGLIALRSIPRGTELTISRVNHHFLMEYTHRSISFFRELGCVCSCKLCSENWSSRNPQKNYHLTESQKKYLKETKLVYSRPGIFAADQFSCNFPSMQDSITAHYHNMCRGLDLFKKLPYTDVYAKIFSDFYCILLEIQYNETKNTSLMENTE